jgi:uncharacterized membrane protein YoaK (UPF0700 family)
MTLLGPCEGGKPEMPPQGRLPVATALGGVGGYVDAVGYVALYHLFTAHQSGNSVGLGVAVGQADWSDALHRLTPIAAFFGGVWLAAIVIDVAHRRGVRSTAALALALEGAMLMGAAAGGGVEAVAGHLPPSHPGSYYGVATLLAGAMGVQSAALSRASGMTVHTTFVTGLVTHLAEAVAVAMGSPGGRRAALAAAGPLCLVWAAYLGGAVAGTVAHAAWSTPCLAVPAAAVLAVAAIDLRRPLHPGVFPTSVSRTGEE